MEMWISKYALTDGVKRMAGNAGSSGVYFYPTGLAWGYKVGKDAHTTEEAAKAAAESMRVKKIASLRKQMAKLEGMKF